ncbi:helix-turn-helix domain-containing protein [Streptomyces peucetius]|uniref:Helix-turn-helix domain-containing protein n=2 Tax=Streptomyces peucetius TaxID=1950 RepID=A0ABY6IH50_STRPE|nr:helix-turn-helix domain-containing protein [Streptomyces peucetius]
MKPHAPSCAKRLRLQGDAAGQTALEIAQIIHEHCSVSQLRAHRLARGLTQKEAAEGVRSLGPRLGEHAPKADAIRLGHWESGRHHPRPQAIALLCEFYECGPGELGFEATGAPPRAALTNDLVPMVASRAVQGHGATESDRLAASVDAARRAVDRTLAAATVSSGQLDLLDEQVLWARQQYVYTPPGPMLTVLLRHLGDIENLAADRQPAAVQVRLSELTAMLATLIADALMKLGELDRSQAWYGTARHAADDSGNTELRARVRAQAAMLPFYYGPLSAAVALARDARMICRGRPTATGAFAAAAEARALAKLGDSKGAEAALRYAAGMFDQVGSHGEDDAFSFPERRFLLYRSGTLTALGRTVEARKVQAQALALYPAETGIDPTLLSLEAAICLAREHSPAEACELAGSVFLRVVPAHRTPIVEERARDVIHALPAAVRGSRAARELREILELPPGQT